MCVLHRSGGGSKIFGFVVARRKWIIFGRGRERLGLLEKESGSEKHK